MSVDTDIRSNRLNRMSGPTPGGGGLIEAATMGAGGLMGVASMSDGGLVGPGGGAREREGPTYDPMMETGDGGFSNRNSLPPFSEMEQGCKKMEVEKGVNAALGEEGVNGGLGEVGVNAR